MFIYRFFAGLSIELFALALWVVHVCANLIFSFFFIIGIPWTVIGYVGGGWPGAWVAAQFPFGAAAIFFAVDFIASYIRIRIVGLEGQ